MIPRANITAWRAHAPWPLDEQVEQDLVLSRALVEVFGRPRLRESLAFRGGTALHKLVFDSPGRYSEDLDLVQVKSGPIGPILADLREALDPWLGDPKWKHGPDGVKLVYRFDSTALPVRSMRVKVEINTREHFSIEGLRPVSFAVSNPWHTAETEVTSFTTEELLGTKMRALYQRAKGRDLFDLWLALTAITLDDVRVVDCFREYLSRSGLRVSRAEFEENMVAKLSSPGFRADAIPLLRERSSFDVDAAATLVQDRLISRLPGEPWKGHVL